MEEIKELETLGTASGEYNSFPDKTARGALEKIPAGFKKEITGQVGQILEVTEVDEEGRITGVTAVDKPDGTGSGENVTNVDVTSIKTVLGNIMTIIKAQTDSEGGVERPQGYNMDVSGLVAQNDILIAALGGSGDSGGDTTEKTLTSISATYSGGSVPVGTAVTALTGIVVTAYYSDGSSAAVTDYTLSGTIAEGENTVTVSYGGKTATITVIGATESGGNDVYTPELLWEAGYRIDTNSGAVVEADGWSVSQLIDISGYSSLRVATTSTTWFNANVMAGTDEYPHTALQHNTSYWGGSYMTDETFDVLAYSYFRIASSTNHAASFTVELK